MSADEIDPITLEVVRNRFDVIAEEMQSTLLRASFSTIVKEGQDASASLFDPRGDVIAQACAIPAHQGMLIPAVKRIVEVFPPETMKDGDVFILNDPYDGGTHLPDITIVVPVIVEGETVALSCTMTHHQDVGGKTPGSVPPDATEIFQEGLRLPPLKLYDAGQVNGTLEAIIRRNVRIPDIVMGDLAAQLAAGQVGRQRLLRLFGEYGRETVKALVAELFDRAETMTRAALRRFPEGTYGFTDYLDNDGIDLDRRIPITASVTLRGGDLIVDFTGTSPQVKGPFNAVPSSVLATVYYVIRAITDPSIPNNAGCFRPVQLHLPPGSLVNPNPPAPVNARSTTIKRIADVLLGALARALPDRIPAAPGGNLLSLPMGGVDPVTGQTYVFTHLIAGGMGARPDRDGIDCIETDVTNCMINPVESVEMSFPVRVVTNRLVTDSGGAGRFRGGLGFERTFEVLRGEAVVSHRGDRHYTEPWGLHGGRSAPPWRSVIVRADGARHEVPSKQVFTLREGDRIELTGAGGAGHGDPLVRPAETVLGDVLDRKVSLGAAREAYGVVIDAATLKVDEDATRRVREEMAAARGPVTWTYDRGALGRE
jgi:N-methylhydantoinase B